MLLQPVRLQIFYILAISNYQCETTQPGTNQRVFEEDEVYTFKIHSFLI